MIRLLETRVDAYGLRVRLASKRPMFGHGSLLREVLGFALLAAAAGAAEWSEFGPAPILDGPYVGRISAVAVSPFDPNRMYVGGASGGVWRTTNGGSSWIPLTDSLPTSAIGALALEPFNHNVIYVGSGEANYANHSLYGLGVYKSTNGGDTWSVLGAETFAGRTISRIVVSHADPSVVYAAVCHAGGFPARSAAKGHPQANGPVGVFRSIDGGVVWTLLNFGLPAVAASDLVMDPSNANILYAAIGDIFGNPNNGVYKSINGGDSWSTLGGGLPAGKGRISLAVAPSQPQRLYALVTNVSSPTGGGGTTDNVYRSDNGGSTWTPTHPGNFQSSYGWYLSTVVVHPTNPDLFLVGGLTLLRSTTGGTSYTDVTPPHVDMHALAYDAVDRLICGNDGGVHRSPNDGDSWSALNDGLGIIQFYPGLSVHPTDPDFLLGGTQDNGTNRRESGLWWTQRLGGDGGYTALHPANPNVMFAEFQGTGNLFRSVNGGETFNSSSFGIVGSDRNCFLPPLTYIASQSGTLLYGTHRVYRSTNNGANWTPISADVTGGGSAAIRGLVVAPSNAQTVYASTNDGRVLVSTNGGTTFMLKLTGINGWPRVKREIAVDPANDSIAYLTVAQFGVDQIRMTTDRGDQWVSIDGDLPDVPANTVAVHSVGSVSTVFAGTDAGVFMTCNAGGSWRRIGTSLPNVPVMDLIVDTAHNRIVAGTLGRGAWSIPLPGSGDNDGSGRVDLLDYRIFQTCFSGPVDLSVFLPPSGSCLDAFDFDFDGDVDGADHICFASRLTGP